MSKQSVLILLFFSISLCLKAQTNLVIDGSFEDATPADGGGYFWMSVNKWKIPNNLSPDYYSDLNNGIRPSYSVVIYQPPKDRYGLVGLIAIQQGYPNTAREYVQGAFTNPLQAGKKYEVKFYVSLVNEYRVAVSHLGAYLSTEPITFTYRCELEPQIESNTILSDTLNWMEIKGEYIAQGGEKHITLGNFRDDKQSDTLVLPVGVNVSPSLHSYYFLDDVSVVCLDCPIDEVGVGIVEQNNTTEIKIYPNPNNGNFIIKSKAFLQYIKIVDLSGRLVYEQKTNSQQVELNNLNLSKGVYILHTKDLEQKEQISKLFISNE